MNGEIAAEVKKTLFDVEKILLAEIILLDNIIVNLDEKSVIGIVSLIENDTAEFEIAENLTSKITQEIAIQNILKITDNSNSDSTILGVITSAADGPFTFDSNEQVDEYRFSISLKILWVDNDSEKNLIEKTFTGFGNYSINNDPSSDGIDNDNDGILDENDDDEFGDSRELAINIAVNKIASDVVNSILSTW